MRIVATSDTHEPFPASFVPDGDVLIHAGDLMQSGYITEWDSRVESLRALPHKLKILVAGNHDIHMGLYAGPALQDLRRAGVHVLGMPTGIDTVTIMPDLTLQPNGNGKGVRLLGLPMVHNLPRWAFNFSDDFLNEYMENKKRADIVISHCPPAGVLDMNFGIKAYRRYLEEMEPDIWICGHIHEHGGESQVVKRTTVYNVAAMDRNYDRVTPPTIIDL